MPLKDADRLDLQAANPRALLLWRALQGLKSCVSFMNTGAHPDDETSALLAVLGMREGFSLSYACANRGEGGQNNIGTEVSEDLGVIRTAEMERASEVLGLRLYWLSTSPADSIFDFGFSKNGVDTLARWGHRYSLSRFVKIVRQERPDIVCPTFLDVPGQHGHHRAMTSLAHEVLQAAADPAFNAAELLPRLPPWQVKKLYLPAWSGGGGSYDDELPPPVATLVVDGAGEDQFSGWSYELLGQFSRRCHRSQGMGRWVAAGVERNWSLHLVQSYVSNLETDTSLSTGLPKNLAALSDYANAPEIADMLQSAQLAIDATVGAFPDLPSVRKKANQALGLVRQALHRCPISARAEVSHRLILKVQQLARVIRIASRVTARAWLEQDTLRPGGSTSAQFESSQGDADNLDLQLLLPPGWRDEAGELHLSPSLPPDDPYPGTYIPDNPRLPALAVTVTVDGQQSTTQLALETSPRVLPARSVRLQPADAIINTALPSRSVKLNFSDLYPTDSTLRLKISDGWTVDRRKTGLTVSAPDAVATGLYAMPLLLNGEQAETVKLIDYPHIQPRNRSYNAEFRVRVMHAALPTARIAYVGGGNDRLAYWLGAMGLAVTVLTDTDIAADSTLAEFDTLVIGIFAFRTRPVLQRNLARIHAWVEAGGNLLTLYHRPWDAWEPDTTPPRSIIIGQPSLRWRVTDENAEVTHLIPEHSLLNTPNRIERHDWQNWHKERGLYFAQAWDPIYQALLSMADQNENPHHGALLSARIGQGRHTHTSLILHHQMEKLVPGAFRLMANLLAEASPAGSYPEANDESIGTV